jgi:hypothetical protein
MGRVRIKIANPLPGGGDFTSLNRAKRFVTGGKARFVDPLTIEFLATPMRAAIVRSAEERLHAKITGANIDAIDRTFYENARNLPLLRAHLMLRGKPAKKREGLWA